MITDEIGYTGTRVWKLGVGYRVGRKGNMFERFVDITQVRADAGKLKYEGKSISKEPNVFPVENHLFFFLF